MTLLDVSFSYFIQQVCSNPALAITTLLTLGVIFVNGWTDAPNAIATCVTTRCLRIRPAVIMAAVLNFFGVFIMTQLNASVASTISNMVDFGGDTNAALIALCAALFSIVVYSVGASLLGIPTSESHSLIAGLSGAPSPSRMASAASTWGSGSKCCMVSRPASCSDLASAGSCASW